MTMNQATQLGLPNLNGPGLGSCSAALSSYHADLRNGDAGGAEFWLAEYLREVLRLDDADAAEWDQRCIDELTRVSARPHVSLVASDQRTAEAE